MKFNRLLIYVFCVLTVFSCQKESPEKVPEKKVKKSFEQVITTENKEPQLIGAEKIFHELQVAPVPPSEECKAKYQKLVGNPAMKLMEKDSIQRLHSFLSDYPDTDYSLLLLNHAFRSMVYVYDRKPLLNHRKNGSIYYFRKLMKDEFGEQWHTEVSCQLLKARFYCEIEEFRIAKRTIQKLEEEYTPADEIYPLIICLKLFIRDEETDILMKKLPRENYQQNATMICQAFWDEVRQAEMDLRDHDRCVIWLNYMKTDFKTMTKNRNYFWKIDHREKFIKKMTSGCEQPDYWDYPLIGEGWSTLCQMKYIQLGPKKSSQAALDEMDRYVSQCKSIPRNVRYDLRLHEVQLCYTLDHHERAKSQLPKLIPFRSKVEEFMLLPLYEKEINEIKEELGLPPLLEEDRPDYGSETSYKRK